MSSESILDPIRNFALVDVSIGYNSASTSIVLASGDGASLPAPVTEGPFNLVWWDATNFSRPSDDPNKEIVRVTARSVDTLTLTRGEEDTTATDKNTGGASYKMLLGMTRKTYLEIDELLGFPFHFLTSGP